MLDIPMTARNASIDEIGGLLERQHETKFDVVVPSTHLCYDRGNLVVVEGATSLDENGVSLVDAVLRPTDQFEEGISGRLDIPRSYIRKMREAGETDSEVLALLDDNVSLWLKRSERNWFVRGFRDTDPDDVGIARAFLSDRYRVVDHIDVVMAALDGIAQGGVSGISIEGCDLSERKLRVRISAPEITAAAPKFFENYRSPFSGQSGRDLPIVQAGLVLSNSETGGGAMTIMPRIVALVCNNGMTRQADGLRKVHVGGQMDEGSIDWSDDTRRKQLELVTAQAKDAVQTFLSQGYIDKVASQLDGLADAPLLTKPTEAVEQVTKGLRYTEEERTSILDFFIRGGDTRPVGVMQAVTAYAQTVEDPDRAAELEDDAFEVLARSAALATA